MLRSCKAGSLVQVQVRAPIQIRSLSSLGRAPTWYVGGGRIEACREHHAPVAQLAGGISLRTRAVRVRISPGAPIHPRSPTGRGPALNAGQCRFEACRGYAPVAQIGRGGRLKSGMLQVRVLRGAPAICSLRQAAKASGLHPDIRRFESVREHHLNSKHASESEKRGPRPITAW